MTNSRKAKKAKIEARAELQRMLNDMLGSMRMVLKYIPLEEKAKLMRDLIGTPTAQHRMLKRLMIDDAAKAKKENPMVQLVTPGMVQ